MSTEFEKELIERSFNQTARILNKAEEIAEQHRDIEALVVISDRWASLAQKVKDIDKSQPVMLGFVPSEEGKDE